MKNLYATLGLSLGLTACAHSQPLPTPAAAQGGVTTPIARSEPAAPTLASCRVDLDCPMNQLCSAQSCVDITPTLAQCKDIQVHFDFDKDDLHAQDEQSLDRAARCLLAEKGVAMMVTGNADERGTEEYNLALGDRRARRVASYLEHRGVSAQQLHTVSYGKDRPLCTEHDEQCWALNRRSAIAPESPTASVR